MRDPAGGEVSPNMEARMFYEVTRGDGCEVESGWPCGTILEKRSGKRFRVVRDERATKREKAIAGRLGLSDRDHAHCLEPVTVDG